VAATTMKLNPKFLSACVAIQSKATTPFEFHFLVGQAQGLVYPQVSSLIKRYLPNAVVHGHQPYLDYMADMATCSLFLSPFPFGNTNGIVDAVTIGLPGVNLSGPEVLEHIDEALFTRLGLPGWLTTKSVDDYVSAAVRLIDDAAERKKIRQNLLKKNAVEQLFKGDAAAFGRLCHDLL
jgi:glycosyltransferase involved in cell wall biosynthesis